MKKIKMYMGLQDILAAEQLAYENVPKGRDIRDAVHEWLENTDGEIEAFMKVFKREMKVEIDLRKEARSSLNAYKISLKEFGSEVDSFEKSLQFLSVPDLLEMARGVARELKDKAIGWEWANG